MSAAPPPRLCMIVEDHDATRAWLADIVRDAFAGAAVAEARSLREAGELLDGMLEKDAPPWLALTDLGLPDGSGVALLRTLQERTPRTLRVVMTAYGDDAYLMEAIGAGAQGYLLKEDEAAALVDTLRRIERDEPPLSPAVARRMLGHFASAAAGGDGAATARIDLTARETETLTLLARGLTIGEAAAQMGLSAHTVAGYSKILYQKLNVSSRAEAAREAVRRGLA